jgi:hypothetical protein
VYVQFSDSVTSAGSATWRIGTTSATTVNLEDCGGCGLSGWGWQDNGYGTGVLGTPVYFASTGTHTLRVQVREDGLSIDQIVLSPTTYFTTAPGALKNDTTILTGGGSTPPPTTITLVREPFLQQVTDRSAVIVWASTQSGPASVRINNQTFAATSTYFSTTTTGMSVSYYQHEAMVTGLAPATTYTYDVFVGSVDANATQDQLRTSPSPGAGTVTFIAFGDSGTGSTAQRTLASRMNGDSFDFAVHAGDVAYGSADGIGDASFTTYTNWFFSIYKNWLRRRPVFPSLGNHDARASNGEGRAYLSVFALPEEGGAGAFPDHAERYYSFDWGPVHVIVLDTERSLQDATRRPAQVSWATTDLSTTTQPWKIAVYHRSPYSSGAEHGSDTLVQQTFGPLFEKYGVQLAISGHDHDYERSTPWRVSTDRTQQAVTYLVTGGGGGPVYTVGKGAFTAVSKSVNHYSRITVSGCQLTIKGIDTAGATFDSWTLDRCKQDADAGPPSVRITSPGTGATVTGVTTVAVDATDDTRVEKVDLWVDGALKAIDVSAPYAFSWDATNVAAGTHLLEARAYDTAGNRVASAKVSVTR